LILGVITFTGFYGADGYTIIIENSEIQVLYAHCSPKFIVKKNQKVLKGEKIGEVGPKYIEAEENTKYFDSERKKNKRCLNWSTSSYNNKKRRLCRQSSRLTLRAALSHPHCFFF